MHSKWFRAVALMSVGLMSAGTLQSKKKPKTPKQQPFAY